MGMGVFSDVFFWVPGRVYLLWVCVSFLLRISGFQVGYICYGYGCLFMLFILEFKVGYICYGDRGLFCCVFWDSR
jgi:hypothetical protein